MLDRETGLYYRDAKYVYPKHKTSSGKKDFWARGDGWVLAGLAKVLKDLPADYEHRSFFVNKYVKLAEAVAGDVLRSASIRQRSKVIIFFTFESSIVFCLYYCIIKEGNCSNPIFVQLLIEILRSDLKDSW